MSLWDFIRPNPLPPGDPATQKAGRKLINRNVDPAVRYQAAETLAGIGSEEAIYCLLQRFTVVIGTNIPDEDEKRFVFDKVVNFGTRSIPPLMRFIREKTQVGQALQVMRKICKPEKFMESLLELVKEFDPYYSKYPDKKIQTFKALSEFRNDQIIDELEPFLDDDDDDVIITAIEGMAAQANDDRIREILIRVILEADERPRVRIKACEVFTKRQWKVSGFRKQIGALLPDQFYLDAKGHIKAKSGYEV
ncbi:HEAT repeat domain-containing protein [bacterium]|nr:HEAT repeat domain-containing protein [candidate division CSSED10-310 bacterium]